MAIDAIRLRRSPAHADAAKESRGVAALAVAGRVGEIPGSVFDTGEHRRPGRMAQGSCRVAAPVVGGRTDQPALCAEPRATVVGFGPNGAGAEPASCRAVRSVAVRVSSARPGVVAALEERTRRPAWCIAPASGLAGTDDVDPVAARARGIRGLPAAPCSAGGYPRESHAGSIRIDSGA